MASRRRTTSDIKKSSGVRRDFIFLTSLSMVILLIGTTSIREKSAVWDEAYYIGTGYYMVKQWDKPWINYTSFIPVVVHPPLSYYVSSIPFYIYDLTGDFPGKELFEVDEENLTVYPPRGLYGIEELRREYPEKFSQKFLYAEEYRPYNLLYYSRYSTLLLLILCSTYLFIFAKRYYGFETACLITTLFSLNPNILAHARLATTDIAPVCFNLISFYYFTRFMEKKSVLAGVITGVTLGLALLSKVSSIYLVILYSSIIAVRFGIWGLRRSVNAVSRLLVLPRKIGKSRPAIRAGAFKEIRARDLILLISLLVFIALSCVAVYNGGDKRIIAYASLLTLSWILYSDTRKKVFFRTASWFLPLLRRLMPYVMIVLFAGTTVNAGYFFNEMNYDWLHNWGEYIIKDVRFFQDERLDNGLRDNIVKLKVPLSDYYLYMLFGTKIHMDVGHAGYIKNALLSNSVIGAIKPGLVKDEAIKKREPVSIRDRLDYWATTLLIKTPEGVIILSFLSIFYFFSKQKKRGATNQELSSFRIYLILNIIIACMIIISSTILTGIRLVLFIFPLIYLLLAEPLKALLNKSRTSRRFAYLIVALSILPTLIYHPHYISYFNQAIGGPENGYKYASDSNIDWGQDLPGLKRYMDENDIKEIKLAYFGTARIEEHGIRYTSMPNNQDVMSAQKKSGIECGPVEGLLAVSTTSRTGQFGDPYCYEWLRKHEPMDNIGYSIWIYNITKTTT
ncbi:MAG: glycosyltransferase family 39 protein [Candidatus Altiarchaeota archaeon]